MTQLREAVEHLRCAAQTTPTGLIAVTHVRVGDKRVLAMPVIKYEEIVGKTPGEVETICQKTDVEMASALG